MGLFEESKMNSALIVEDDAILSSSLEDWLTESGWEVETATTAREARAKLSERIYDLVLNDYLLPDADGLSIVEEVRRRSPLTMVLLMTGVNDFSVAVQAIKKGAVDFVCKPFDLDDLEGRITRLMEEKRLQLELELRQAELEEFHQPPDMVGQSPAMKKVYQLIELVAGKNVTVLVAGESGTGKEVVARAIHAASERKSGPFVALNCGAIPENLLEDELFGHVRGAYTDAHHQRIGKFEQADGGTLFLDEIGNMPLSLQIKLLRVLEEREFQKLGSNQNVRVDVRILAATNCNLLEKVKAGTFREDLFYRLNVVPVHLPPLRERKEDLPLLARHFLQAITREYKLTQKNLSPSALKRLMQYQWPGNVRELRNALELACVLADERSVLQPEDFALVENTSNSSGECDLLPSEIHIPEDGLDLNQVVSELEKKLICESLQRTQGNKGKAARLLSLNRTTLVEKLRRMNLLEQSFGSA